MEAFPLSWPLAGRRVVLFGDGPLAARKRALLEKTPATLVPLGPDSLANYADPALTAGLQEGSIALQDALRGAAFAIVALEDSAQAEAAAALARAAGVPVNVVDRPDLSDFHIPAIVDRGDITIAVASGGAAPALARDVRARIEAAVPASTTLLAGFAKAIRPLARTIRDYDTRRRAWERILRGPAGEAARRGEAARAEALARDEIAASGAGAGVVHIVGAGPGDPELLTLKALRLLQDADVIVHDRLVDRRILDMARRDADFVYVGKEGARERSKHSVPQDQINALLIAEAKAGRRVIRLKGGDPFVFGRGGEELDALRAAGVAAFVTPGITAALGVAAQAQAPLTHRDYAQAVTFVTGHAQTGGAPALDWRALAAANHTLVIYMGAANAAEIAQRLIAAGRAAKTPALIVENGTRPEERRFATSLDRLAADIAVLDLKSPSLLIVGEAARQAEAASAIIANAERTGA